MKNEQNLKEFKSWFSGFVEEYHKEDKEKSIKYINSIKLPAIPSLKENDFEQILKKLNSKVESLKKDFINQIKNY